MNILYIGATGRVGSHVVPRLAKNFNLTLVAPTLDVVGGIKVHPLDITQWEATEAFIKQGAADGKPFDAIVYCATANYRAYNQGDAEGRRLYFESCIEVNMRGAYHVMEAAWRADVARVVHVGSLTSILGAPYYERITAETRNRPNDLYAATKIFGENIGRMYAFRPEHPHRAWHKTWPNEAPHEREPMPVICLRLGQPYEETNYRQDLEWIQRWRDKGTPLRPPRVPVHMEDIAEAIKCAATADISYGVYSIVSKTEDSMIDPELYAELGYKPRWEFFIDRAERLKDIPPENA